MITLRGLVAEFANNVSKVYYSQPSRKHGKSKKSFMKNFDYAMKSFTTYTKIAIHLVMIMGIIMAILSILVPLMLIVAMPKTNMKIDTILIIWAVSFFGSIQLFSIGLIGEYILSINTRLLKRPFAIEAERVGNWENSDPKPNNSSPYIAYEPLKKI